MARPNTIEKFHTLYKIDPNTDCWEWTLVKHDFGHGIWRWNNKYTFAHRVSAELFIRSLEPGDVVCHKCDNPCCVNPKHLYIGTQQDNIRDRNVRGRTARGTQANKSNLTEQDVLNIRADTTSSQKDLGLQYNVSYHAIRKICNRETWKLI